MNLSAVNVLHIEDNIGDRVILEEYLHDSVNIGLLQHCSTLKEGFEHIKKYEFDLILLDLSLPDSYGLQGLSSLNQQINFSIPIIVFTGLNDNEVAVRALSLGAQDFIIKGDYSLSLINKTIRYAIERHKVQHELILKSKALTISRNMLSRAESMAHVGSWEINFENEQVQLSHGMKSLLDLDSDSNEITVNQFLSFVHKEDKETLLAALNDRNSINLTTTLESRFVRKNGDEFYASCKLETATTAGNNYVVYGVTLDISLQKEIELVKAAYTLDLSNKVKQRTQELERTKLKLEQSLSKEKELGELKSRFVSTASHQFRTPLTVIRSNVGLLKMQSELVDRELIPSFDKITQRIDNEVTRMTEIMDDVLILGKINSGGIQPVFRSVNMVDICSNIMNKYNEIQRDGRKAILRLEGEERTVEMDKNLLEDAFSNVLSNAFKYSFGKPAPEVTLIYKNKSFVLEVKDFGIGIPEQDIKNLFDPFYRASNAVEISGNGLGTTIMKEYFELNRGQVDVKSVLNEGTTFAITFEERQGA